MTRAAEPARQPQPCPRQQDLAVHWNAMVRAARSVLGSRAEAEDCAGQALLQVLEQGVEDVINLEAYLVTVAKRRAIDRLRHLERARRRDEALAAQERGTLGDPAEDVSRRAEARWMSEQAQRRLDPRSYDVLRRYADGEPMASIAASHGLQEGAARTVLYRARTLLKNVYAKGLAVLGLGWACGRRTLPTSAVAVAAAALVVTLLPHVTRPGMALPPERRQGAGAVPTVAAAVARPGPLLAAKLRTPPRPPAPVRPPRGAPGSGPTIVRGPAGAGLKVERQQRGDDSTSDPVAIVLDCFEHFQVTPSHLGC